MSDSIGTRATLSAPSSNSLCSEDGRAVIRIRKYTLLIYADRGKRRPYRTRLAR
ncbi:hypothetical protein [Candidatus Pelagisphaera phototrophica]|uniref:hypothetical protein n=1 Tax=Candidatus Pelagisphaera phototrophica TaxID=2684113 RepID=UPI0019EACC0A|nr:hypothetical protein [Candidatus Pelagisphaera phototrophica]QXD33504.1 hypothetical protein GA004_07335 [Candidatus Pelagisphaera phototrophica]